MYIAKLKKLPLTAVLLAIIVTLLSLSVGSSSIFAQENTGYLREIRTFDNSDIGLSNPIGLTYSNQGIFFVLEPPTDRQTNIVMMTPYGQIIGNINVDTALTDNRNVTFNESTSQLLFFKPISQELVKITVDTDKTYSKPFATTTPLASLSLQEPRGMVIDQTNGQLLFLDSAAQQLVSVRIDNGKLPTITSRINLKHIGVTDAQGLAYNPTNDHLYFLSPSQQKVYEITKDGLVTATFDLATFGFSSLQTVVVAPSGDSTDDPTTMNLYIVDKTNVYRTASDRVEQRNGISMGQIAEISMAEPVQRSLMLPTDVATLVNLTETSEFSPPSPDPAGLAYLSNSNTLLISDSEVNEMTIFEGYNLFQTTLSGDLVNTLTSIDFSNEPTDVTYNPANDHLFITDDSGDRGIYEVNPGADGLYNTGDDTITFFSTEVYGATDSEGASFNTWNGHLFFTDGLNEEVYEIDPGPNGIFDGAPPAGDDIMAHFDVSAMGIQDPEGSAFNWHNGHLYVLGHNDLIAEVTTDGVLIRYIDIASLDATRLAGLVYAPASTDPNQYNIYIVARGVDNGQDPNENDGKMFEVSFPNNNIPVVNAGPDQITPDSMVNLDGTVSDDGLPDPPGILTTSWSKISGPGTVSFADASAVDTPATFSASGVYVLRLTADDGELQGTDDIKITALPSGPNQPPTVDAGPNQTIVLLDGAALDGTAADDGLPYPPSAVTTSWSEISGPGTVTFANANAVDTTATFSAIGTYVLRLTADDSELSASDDVTITVNAPPPQTTIEIRVNSNSDDAEEASNGNVDVGSSDLELVYDGSNQVVGMRFNSVSIPPTATILNAYIQFQVDENPSNATSLIIRGQAADNPTTFNTTNSSISSRPLTSAVVNWNPPPWPTVGQAGPDQRTPNISSVIQEIVNRPGWSNGNSLVVIVTGTGERVAESYNGDQAGAPLLVITYGTNNPPTVDAGVDQTVTFPNMANLDGTVSDDGLPNPPGVVTTSWDVVSGPGTVTFGDATAVDTTASFSAAGEYVLRLTADDSQLTGSDDVTITVNATNTAPVVDAGPDQAITLPNSANLDGSVSDDGLPNPPGTVTTLWDVVSGPGTVTFADTTAVNTTASFSVAGVYVLRLTADDNELTANDEVTITVNAANTAPVVDAGADQAITLPASAALDGTASDDGLPSPPATVTTLWDVVSGPGTVTFADATAEDTTASFSVAGVYVLRLTADDSELTASDELTVTVSPVTNQAPVVDAGTDQAVTLASAANLDGTVSDDGLPNPPATVTTVWDMVSGPGTVTFADATAVDTTASFSAVGEYVLQLTANDSELTASDEVTITVNAANTAPVVDAGPDQALSLPTSAALDGTVSDDGLPNPPGVTTTLWDVVSGPGTVTFGDASAEDTTASFSVEGVYVLQLTADDSELTASDEVTITVEAANTAPIVDAGVDETISLPSNAKMNGSATDDGRPNPPGMIVTTWSQFSGPGTATFTNIHALSTNATFSVEGVYVLQLTADDSELSATDYVTITVTPPNQAPVVDAGVDQTVALTETAVLDGTATDDGLPNPPAAVVTSWSQVSGPGTAVFANANAVDTTATFSASGAYVLRLTANDGALSASDDVLITVSLPANQAPVVDAGPNAAVTLPNTIQLQGSVTDDGYPNPPAAVTTLWTAVSGPGAVTFSDATVLNPVTSFATSGVYVLQLTADDGEQTARDEVTITVIDGVTTLEVRISESSADAEESSAGRVSTNSSDLELVFDGGGNQTVGMTFGGITIPRGAIIVNAYVQFKADEKNSGATTLTIQAEDTDNAPTFTTSNNNVSSRDRTASAVTWQPAPWTIIGEAGPAQKTSDISAVIQEIINRNGWANGNSMALIITGTGERVAEAYNGDQAGAPLLHVEYYVTGQQPPVVNAGPDQVVNGDTANLDGTVTDDGLPNPPGAVTSQWTLVSGPGTVIFADATAVDTTASFSNSGDYVLRLTADDGQLTASDEVHVTVFGAGGQVIIEVQVTASSDDAEEEESGNVDLNSSDLELVFDGSNQTVGVRFNDIVIPQGATVTNAYIQFTVDEKTSVATSLLVQAENSNNAVTFADTDNNISARPKTTAAVAWSPPAWSSVGNAGPDQRTPNIATVVQEIVSRPGWLSNNSLVIILTGTGERVADSYDGGPSTAPILHIEYTTDSNFSPSAPHETEHGKLTPSNAYAINSKGMALKVNHTKEMALILK